MKRETQSGFTIVELMIVLAIVAIIVALAVPAYQDYSVRSKVAECINFAAVPKLQIAEYRHTMGPWPPTTNDAGLYMTADSQYCNGFSTYDSNTGAFTIDVDENAVGASTGLIEAVMTPTTTPANFIIWDCGRGNTSVDDLKYLPSTCRDGS